MSTLNVGTHSIRCTHCAHKRISSSKRTISLHCFISMILRVRTAIPAFRYGPNVLVVKIGKLLFKTTITGEPHSKANSRKVAMNRATGRKLYIKSQGARDYCASFASQMICKTKPEKPLECKLILVCKIFYAFRRKDLDESLIMDCLEKTRVIKNDNLIEQKHIYREADKNNPRSEIKLFQLTD